MVNNSIKASTSSQESKKPHSSPVEENIRKKHKRKHSPRSESKSPVREKKSKHSKKSKRKKKHSRSSSSSSSSSSGSSSSTDSEEERERRKRKKAKKKAKKIVKELKKIQKKKEKLASKNKAKEKDCNDVPIELMERAKKMVPMTKEEWEKKQSVVKRVYDEETGRHRLIKGDGEVIEEIVSRERHKSINKQATVGDGNFFQSQLNSRLKK